MSAWGTKIFDNDLALDMKTDFIEMFSINMSIKEIELNLLSYISNDDEAEVLCPFWTALSDLEWQYGILQEKTKEKAKYIILNKPDIDSYIQQEDKVKRKEELEKLYKKLDTINQKIKKKRTVFVYRTEWEQGDIFAIPLNGKYVYIHIVGKERKNHRIKELAIDAIYIKVFNILTVELLDARAFHKRFFHKIGYKKINNEKGEDRELERLWCVGKREKISLEKKVIKIGNKKVKQRINGRVSIYWQFKELENTLAKLFDIN
ncbi:TPA: hypothetical protein KOS20_004410 [Clostridioides difficile]|nr:hypothetical protein [Clostridioides difficile]HBF6015548.1 hypothetical protein [Clostridioides difficile]